MEQICVMKRDEIRCCIIQSEYKIRTEGADLRCKFRDRLSALGKIRRMHIPEDLFLNAKNFNAESASKIGGNFNM